MTKEEIISITLDLDQSVFKPRVIQRGFRDTGLWTFDPKKMETRAANDIREKEKGANSVAEACATAFLPMIKSLQKENHKKVESVPVDVTLNALFDPFLKIALADEKERLEKERKAEKLEEKEKKAREKEEKQEKREKEREENRCRGLGCSKHFRGGVSWVKCRDCGVLFCQKHKGELKDHQCDQD